MIDQNNSKSVLRAFVLASFLVLSAILVSGVLFVSGCATAGKTSKKAGEKMKNTDELKSEYNLEQDEEKKFYLLTDIVNQYASKDIPAEDKIEVKVLANSLLKMAPQYKGTWNYGNAVHDSNLVLGRIQLLDGKLKSAADYLIAASKVPGSPQLNSFGPNMTLAKEMLEKNQRTPVIQYITNCLKFWKGSDAVDRTTKWKKEIGQGQVPDFGSNLVY